MLNKILAADIMEYADILEQINRLEINGIDFKFVRNMVDVNKVPGMIDNLSREHNILDNVDYLISRNGTGIVVDIDYSEPEFDECNIVDENVSHGMLDDAKMCKFHTLNEFIVYNKQFYDTKRKCRICTVLWDAKKYNGSWLGFDEIFHDFISVYLHEWKISRDEIVTMWLYDDFVVVYTKNEKFEYVFE